MNKQALIAFIVVVIVGLVGVTLMTRNGNVKKEMTLSDVSVSVQDENTGAEEVTQVPAASGTIVPTLQNDKNMMQFDTQPAMELVKGKKYTAVLNTDEGQITVALLADKNPITVNNFVFLARKGFYNKTIFHRVIEDFMIQGGDPTGTGAGGPGYRFDDEPFTGDYKKGTLAMANSGPNTNGSQFFIMHGDVPLPKNYVIFGKVEKGLDVVDAIATAPVTYGSPDEKSKPIKPVAIKTITIEEK